MLGEPRSCIAFWRSSWRGAETQGSQPRRGKNRGKMSIIGECRCESSGGRRGPRRPYACIHVATAGSDPSVKACASADHSHNARFEVAGAGGHWHSQKTGTLWKVIYILQTLMYVVNGNPASKDRCNCRASLRRRSTPALQRSRKASGMYSAANGATMSNKGNKGEKEAMFRTPRAAGV